MLDKVPEGYVLVPIEPTPEMYKACKGALYRYITALGGDERMKFKDRKRGGGYRVDQRTKVKIRWQAMLAAANSAPCVAAPHPSVERDPSVMPDCHGAETNSGHEQ